MKICGICGRTISSSIHDIHVNNRVRRSLPQIALMHTDVGARRMLITDLSDYSDFLKYLKGAASVKSDESVI